MAFGGQSRQRWGDNTIQSGAYLRDLQVTDLSGRVNHTGPLRSKGALLLAFLDDSPSSREALPTLQKLIDACKESGKLSALGIFAGDEAAARALTNETGIGFPVALDHGGYLAMTYGLSGYPTIYLAAASGAVALKLRAPLRPKHIEALVEKAATLCGIEPISL